MRYFSFIIILLLIGCRQEKEPQAYALEGIENEPNVTIYPADSEPLYDIEIKEEVSYRSPNGIVIGDIFVVKVSDSLVFISDYSQKTIHVFEKNGTYIQNIGREGRGPGEFADIANLLINNNHLYVQDNHLKRIHVFSIENLKYSTSINLNVKNRVDFPELEHPRTLGSFIPLMIYEDGSFLIRFEEAKLPIWQPEDNIDGAYYYYTLNQEGTRIGQKIHEREYAYLLSDEETMRRVPFDSKPLVRITNNGSIISGSSSDLFLKIYDSHGRYQYSFYYPLVKRKLTENQAQEIIRSILENNDDRRRDYLHALSNTELPPTWPALESIKVDGENRLWIATIVEDTEIYEWWVLDISGKLLARFEWPVNRRIVDADQNNLYTIDTNENGEELVKSYSFVLE